MEDEFPLVVRLPCWDRRDEAGKKDGGGGGGGGLDGHVFDLECIAAWLKLNRTCPIDRVDLIEREERRREELRREVEDRRGERERGEVGDGGEEEEEEEWDGMFA